MIRLIVATDPTGLMGVTIKHTEDGSPPVGEGVGGTPRRNWIIKDKMPWHYKQDLRRFKKVTMDVWIAGGRQIYDLALESGCVEEIDHTLVPAVDLDRIEHLVKTTMFDLMVLDDYELVGEEGNPLDERLTHRRYRCPLPTFS